MAFKMFQHLAVRKTTYLYTELSAEGWQMKGIKDDLAELMQSYLFWCHNLKHF